MLKNFYDREQELHQLMAAQQYAHQRHSTMTVLTGRRRIGKTSLGQVMLKDTGGVYLFIGRKSETLLCEEFENTIRTTIPDFPSGQRRFADIFQSLLLATKTMTLTVFIDEFQDFEYVNPSVFSDMQNLWDRYRNETHINLVLSGSVFTMMNKIFRDAKEPLFGRADKHLLLKPFSTTVIKEMLHDAKPDYNNEDLLALFTYTGGIPKYMQLLLENGCTDKDTIIRHITKEDSAFIEEGRFMLIQEFGKHYETYFTILSLIATGELTQADISVKMGGTQNIGGFLKRLEEDYGLISKKRPIRAKPASQTVRYEIKDIFLKFWFRYMEKYRSLIEIGNYKQLHKIVHDDYTTFSGQILERWFRTKLQESQQFVEIGGWWLPDQKMEIDIVTVDTAGKVTAHEVKRQRSRYKAKLLKNKCDVMQAKIFKGQKISLSCLSIDDM